MACPVGLLFPVSSTGWGHLWTYTLMSITGGNDAMTLRKAHDPGWREMTPRSGSLQSPQATLPLPPLGSTATCNYPAPLGLP